MKSFVSVSVIILAAFALTLTRERPVAGQPPAPAIPPPGVPLGGAAVSPVVRAQADPDLVKLLTEESGLEAEIRGLVDDYGRTPDEGKRTAIKAKLSPLLDKQFDLQQKRREFELAQLEAQLKKVRDLMQKRGDARKTIVEKRLDQILREAEGLGWTPPPGGAGGMIPRPRPAFGEAPVFGGPAVAPPMQPGDRQR